MKSTNLQIMRKKQEMSASVAITVFVVAMYIVYVMQSMVATFVIMALLAGAFFYFYE